eukprot:GEZU01002022.1.p1 GENE.GEZU01002022.1~~GEZU01002022.1.p1  ORF type:complete len:130 (-),score=36.41 GEZU01002022.1:22-372(-)
MARPEEPTLLNIASEFFKQYNKTPRRLKVIDVFLVYILLTGIIQFVYCALVGTFPFNSFLAGFISCIGLFVLTVSLRMQVNPLNKDQFKGITLERAFADYVLCAILLFFVAINFMG